MKILSDNQLYPTNKPFFPAAAQPSQLFPNFPILTQNFLPPNEKEEMTEPQPDLAESAEASEMTNTKSNNDSNVPSHREARFQIRWAWNSTKPHPQVGIRHPRIKNMTLTKNPILDLGNLDPSAPGPTGLYEALGGPFSNPVSLE